MLKKSAEAKVRTSLEVKCGQCQHFITGPKQYEDLCSRMGVKASASPCDAYAPDVAQLRKVSNTALIQLRDLYANLSTSQAKILAVSMARQEWFKKAGLEFMQEVVFCFGQNYLSNYARGYVVAVNRSGDEVSLTSTIEGLNKGANASLRLLRESVLTLDQFKTIKTRLIKDNKIVEPSRGGTKRTTFDLLTMSRKEHDKYVKLLQVKPDDYIPPTLDTVPTTWRDSRALTKVRDPMAQKVKSVKIKRD